jgi:hypothetical protein
MSTERLTPAYAHKYLVDVRLHLATSLIGSQFLGHFESAWDYSGRTISGRPARPIMPTEHAALLLRHIRKMAAPPVDAVSDRELLRRFAERRDEEAFAVLIDRHGAMVLRVCRRVLAGSPEVEDAFQSTFLALARKAGAIRWHESAAGWLYSAACNTARRGGRVMPLRADRAMSAERRPASAPIPWRR